MRRAAAALVAAVLACAAPTQRSQAAMDADTLYDLFWEKAQDDPALAENIGRMLITGAGAVRDVEESARWFQIGAAAGRPYSIGRLGYICEHVDEEWREAYLLYRAAADLGDGPSAAAVGRCLGKAVYVGSGNTDAELAREYYLLALEGGYLPAIQAMAQQMLDAELPGTREEVLYWYEFAISRGQYQFCVPAGVLYQEGFDTEHNPQRALALYRLAEASGQEGAHFFLWAAYTFGRLADPDPEAAAEHSRKGVALGQPLCLFMDAHAAMKADDRDPVSLAKNALAMQLARDQISRRGAESANRQVVRLGKMCLDGSIVDYDPELAWKCFDAAADAECAEGVRDAMHSYRFNRNHHHSGTIAIKLAVVLFENSCTQRFDALRMSVLPPAFDRHLAPEDVGRLERLAAAHPALSAAARFARDLGLDLEEEPPVDEKHQRLLALREKADGGSVFAAQTLSVILADPTHPLFDAGLALPLLRDLNSPDGTANDALARNLVFGVGCEPDPNAAIAAAEDAEVRFNGDFYPAYARYCSGAADRAEFLDSLRRAAMSRGGIVPGTPLLALMAEEHPRGVAAAAPYLRRPEDYSRAKAVHRKIARIANSTSVQERASLVASMQPEANLFLYLPNLLIAQALEASEVPSEQQLARANYEKAAAVHWPLGLLGLARMLEQGRGGPADAPRAAELRRVVRRIGYPSE